MALMMVPATTKPTRKGGMLIAAELDRLTRESIAKRNGRTTGSTARKEVKATNGQPVIVEQALNSLLIGTSSRAPTGKPAGLEAAIREAELAVHPCRRKDAKKAAQKKAKRG